MTVANIRTYLMLTTLLILGFAMSEARVPEWLTSKKSPPQTLKQVIHLEFAREVPGLIDDLVVEAGQTATQQIRTLMQEIESRAAPVWSHNPVSAAGGESLETIMLSLMLYSHRQGRQLSAWRSEIDHLSQLHSDLTALSGHLSDGADFSLDAHFKTVVATVLTGNFSTIGTPYYETWAEITFALRPVVGSAIRTVEARKADLIQAESRLAADHETLKGNLKDWVMPGILEISRESAANAGRHDANHQNAMGSGASSGAPAATQNTSNTTQGLVPSGSSQTMSGYDVSSAQLAPTNVLDWNNSWTESSADHRGGESTTTETDNQSNAQEPTTNSKAQELDRQSEATEKEAEVPNTVTEDMAVLCNDDRCQSWIPEDLEDSSDPEDDNDDNGAIPVNAQPLTVVPDPESGAPPEVPCYLEFSCDGPGPQSIPGDFNGLNLLLPLGFDFGTFGY